MGGGAGGGGARPELACAWASPRLHGSHRPDCWGQGWGLTGWSRGPGVVRFLLGRTEVSCELGAVLSSLHVALCEHALARDWVKVRGAGVTLISCFHSLPSMLTKCASGGGLSPGAALLPPDVC